MDDANTVFPAADEASLVATLLANEESYADTAIGLIWEHLTEITGDPLHTINTIVRAVEYHSGIRLTLVTAPPPPRCAIRGTNEEGAR